MVYTNWYISSNIVILFSLSRASSLKQIYNNIAHIVTMSIYWYSFISTTLVSTYHNLEWDEPSQLKIRHQYHMHRWTLDEHIKSYVVLMRLHGISYLRREHRSCSGDCACIAMASEDPQLSLSSWRGYCYVLGRCTPSSVVDWRQSYNWRGYRYVLAP